MNVVILIPARLNSSRFPGKPLASINGEPMIRRVARLAQQSAVASDVHVLTDSQQIIDALPDGVGVLSDRLYNNGTERCADYAHRYPKQTTIVIWQGDEVAISGRDIDYAVASVAEYGEHVATLLSPVREPPYTKHDVYARVAPSRVIVEFKRGDARLGYHHVGVYIAKRYQLDKYAAAARCGGEAIDQLEQLRWDSIGVPIRSVYLNAETASVNNPEDIPKVERLICQNASTLVGVPAQR